ncbi:MAG: leucine-rich repeat protein [Oscillospiraceae bacterium]|nr:leucine-rich repeat protein [Oscillospiraceae bacterium]
MKLKILSLFLAFVLLLSVLPTVFAEESELPANACGEKLTWTLDNDTGVLTISGSGAMFNYSRYNLDQFAPWESQKDSVKRVVLPDGITEIGEYAFWRCGNLESVNFPNGLKRIGTGAFEQTGLTAIVLPDSVERIEAQAFLSCEKLASVSLPDTLKELGFKAFGATAIYSAQLTETSSDVYIDKYLVAASQNDLSKPIDYHVKDGTVGIAAGAFNVFGDILSVYVPASVRSLSPRAFDDDYLRNVYFAKDSAIEEIGSHVFYGASLNHIELPASVKKIDAYAFGGLTDSNVPRIVNELCFFGAAPEVEENAFVHENGKQAVGCIYCINGQDGWSYPSWNNVAARWWNGEKVYVNHFVDLAYDAWYLLSVDYAVGNGLMNGVSDAFFAPNDPMTRAMLVTVLWRYEDCPEAKPSSFTDLTADWYKDAVAWAAENGIVNGVGDNKFDPNGSVTREQMATILYRYAQKKGFDVSASGDLKTFPDAGSVSAYAGDAIAWTVGETIINGNDGRLDPQGNATRAQVATILMRFIENVAKK